MTTALKAMQEELAHAARAGDIPVSWELSDEAMAGLIAQADDATNFTRKDADSCMVFGLPIATTKTPGFVVVLVTQ